MDTLRLALTDSPRIGCGMIKARQCDDLECLRRRYLGIEVDRAATDRFRCFAGAERIAAFRLGLRHIGDGGRPGQPIGDMRNSGRVAVRQLDLDLADCFAASLCLDEAVIDRNLEIGVTSTNWEGGALDHRLENRPQPSLQFFCSQRLERSAICELQIGRITIDFFFPLIPPKSASYPFFDRLNGLQAVLARMSDPEHQAVLAQLGFCSIEIYRDELLAFWHTARKFTEPRQACDVIDGGC